MATYIIYLSLNRDLDAFLNFKLPSEMALRFSNIPSSGIYLISFVLF